MPGSIIPNRPAAKIVNRFIKETQRSFPRVLKIAAALDVAEADDSKEQNL